MLRFLFSVAGVIKGQRGLVLAQTPQKVVVSRFRLLPRLGLSTLVEPIVKPAHESGSIVLFKQRLSFVCGTTVSSDGAVVRFDVQKNWQRLFPHVIGRPPPKGEIVSHQHRHGADLSVSSISLETRHTPICMRPVIWLCRRANAQLARLICSCLCSLISCR